MPYEEYWNSDCTLVRYYRQAHRLKMQRRNQELWLQGMYIYEALCDVSPVLHAFAARGTKPAPYPSQPYPLTYEDSREARERKEARCAGIAMAKVSAWAAGVNIRMAKAGKEESPDG